MREAEWGANPEMARILGMQRELSMRASARMDALRRHLKETADG